MHYHDEINCDSSIDKSLCPLETAVVLVSTLQNCKEVMEKKTLHWIQQTSPGPDLHMPPRHFNFYICLIPFPFPLPRIWVFAPFLGRWSQSDLVYTKKTRNKMSVIAVDQDTPVPFFIRPCNFWFQLVSFTLISTAPAGQQLRVSAGLLLVSQTRSTANAFVKERPLGTNWAPAHRKQAS